MEFKTSSLSIQDWRNLLAQSENANWMQSWPYAKASYLRDYRSTKVFHIHQNGGPIGFMALQEIKLGPFQILELKRGPLWFETPKEKTLKEFAELFQNTYPRRLLQRRRWMPEWEKQESTRDLIVQTGFVTLPQTFQTVWLDLTPSPQELRRNLQQKWRNSLNKCEKSGVDFFGDWRGQNLDSFLKHYDFHKRSKGFHGVSSQFIREEIRTALPFHEALLIWARHNNEGIAGGYFLLHGNTASYRIGWNTPQGRKLNAHYGLLWKALELFQARGIKAFDLGGIKPIEAQGVSHFKMGLNGKPVELLGLYR